MRTSLLQFFSYTTWILHCLRCTKLKHSLLGVTGQTPDIFQQRAGKKKASLTGIEETLNGHNSKSLGNSVIISLGRLNFTYEVVRGLEINDK